MTQAIAWAGEETVGCKVVIYYRWSQIQLYSNSFICIFD